MMVDQLLLTDRFFHSSHIPACKGWIYSNLLYIQVSFGRNKMGPGRIFVIGLAARCTRRNLVLLGRSVRSSHPTYLWTHVGSHGPHYDNWLLFLLFPKLLFSWKNMAPAGWFFPCGKSNMAAPMASRHVATTWWPMFVVWSVRCIFQWIYNNSGCSKSNPSYIFRDCKNILDFYRSQL